MNSSEKEKYVDLSLSKLFEIQTDVYKSLELSDLWSAENKTFYWTNNNYIATHYANILAKIIRYSPKIVNIVEIGAGFGRFSYLLIKKIKEHFEDEQFQFRYIMTDISPEISQKCKSHPKLQQFIKEGILEFAVLDVTTPGDAKLLSGEKLSWITKDCCNVVISNFVFSDLAGDLFTIKRNNLYKSFIHFENSTAQLLEKNFTETLKKIKFQFSHTLIETDIYSSSAYNNILEKYKKELKRGSFVNPVEMFSFFDYFQTESSSFYWLITDEANTSLDEFINAKPKFYRMDSGMVSNPINLHALQLYIKSKEYKVIKRDVPNKWLDTYLIAPSKDSQNKTFECDINTFNVDDYIRFYRSMLRKTKSHRDLLMLIRLSNHDPQVLQDYFNLFTTLAPRGKSYFRNTVKQYLNLCWDNYYAINNLVDMPYMIARVFHSLKMYGEAIHYYHLSINNKSNENNLLNLGNCFHDIGFDNDALLCYQMLRDTATESSSNVVEELIYATEELIQNHKTNGMLKVDSRELFNTLAFRNSIPGFTGVLQCKFIITHIDTQAPILYFTDANQYEFHYKFYRNVLGNNVLEKTFDDTTYYKNEGRINVSGSIVVYHNLDEKGKESIYTVDFCSIDPVMFKHVKLSWDMIRLNMPFVNDLLYYHLSSQIQLENYENEKTKYLDSDIKIITTDTLFSRFSMIPVNIGSAYGVLRILDAQSETSMNDIVVYRTLPNNLSNVCGVISEEPQTPLSHINLKAVQNRIPNAYIKNAAQLNEFISLNGKQVFFEVTADGYEIRKASNDELKQKKGDISKKSRIVPHADYN